MAETTCHIYEKCRLQEGVRGRRPSRLLISCTANKNGRPSERISPSIVQWAEGDGVTTTRWRGNQQAEPEVPASGSSNRYTASHGKTSGNSLLPTVNVVMGGRGSLSCQRGGWLNHQRNSSGSCMHGVLCLGVVGCQVHSVVSRCGPCVPPKDGRGRKLGFIGPCK